MEDVHGCPNCIIDEFVGGVFVCRRFKIDECTNDLTDRFVRGFNNRVCSGHVRRNHNRFYSAIIKQKVKVATIKFRAMIVYNANWSRILR